ncbi:hypothetical protein C1I97_33575 [Streptomyces sp. NTH33]|uniref:hypothetical protein n=1 Tax=Streptomyces sp. NTH33 TaxID=1735453 RepID=UPI000DA84AEB|nr:hypothetical protein [Streptomyces sp. NTH33]PZG85509.1 hypothetical protein C1I97_33575 [Streptomyces sp. NTH33]
MPTLTLPRTFGSRIGATAVLTALTAAGATWLAAPAAMAQGEGGDIRIHRVGVPFGVPKDDPVVCRFYLEAVNFDSLGAIAYTIQAQPPLPTSATVNGTIALGAGVGRTEQLVLTDGQYKLIWAVGTTPNREKLFRINCRDDHDRREGAPGPGGHQIEDPGRGDGDHRGGAAAGHDSGGGPRGAVHAGAGGLAPTAAAFSPLTGAAAVGLVVVGGAAYCRLARRRPHRVA